LLYFSLGLVFFAGARIVAAAFYSMQDTRTPVKIAIIAMITNAVLNVILMRFLQVGGLALATTLASGLNMLLLLQLLRKRLGLLGARQMVRTGLKVVLASLVMGLACFLLRQWVIAALAAGAAVFILMVHLLKVEEFKYLKNIVLRRQISEL
jgi:putative peptidoglycan lipid II flippase